MALNFIENHRQKYFCSAHYLTAKDVKNSLMPTISHKRFFSLDELALFVEPDIKQSMIAWASAGGAKRAFSPWKLELRTKYFWKNLKSVF